MILKWTILKNTSATAFLFGLDVLLSTLKLEVLSLLFNGFYDCIACSFLLNFRMLGHTCLCHWLKCLGYVFTALGTDFKILDALFVAKLLDLFFSDCAWFTIKLIPEQIDLYVGLAKLLDFAEPEVVDVLEGLLVEDVVDDEDTLGSFVVRACDSSESLLAGSVPYLQFYWVAFQIHRSGLDIMYLKRKSTPIVAR